ncbi:uncharacterized protein LOC143922050 [Arctopsyche grandis]|uniref:uncharacterized protein LOC143922050 n=1 Tax=Arctopsyche grandis TaxID=121162 RepID=UPI00406D67BE
MITMAKLEIPPIDMNENALINFLFKTCVFCNGQQQLKSIHKNHFDNGRHENYSDMLIACFNIKMVKGTAELKICNECIKGLKSACKFRENVELANMCLKKHFTPVNTSKKLIDSVNYPFTNFQSKKNEKNDDDDDDDYSSSGEDVKTFEIDFDPNYNESKFNDSSNAGKKDSYTKIKTDDVEVPKSQSSTSQYKKAKDLSEFLCHVCGRSCLNKDGLAKHMVTHADKRVACKLCQKSYANSGSLNQHVRRAHKGIKTYCCTICPERFSDYVGRNMHLTKVHDQPYRNYICPTCGKTYYRSSRLSIHIRRDHDKSKNFACTECDKMFFSSSELKMHTLSHSSERNFECKVCRKSYARKKTLTEHLKIHANIRSHKCDYCGKAFVQKCTLKSHLKTHRRM